MKRNFAVGLLGGLIGSAMLLILLSATGMVSARSSDVAQSDVSRMNAATVATLPSTFTYQGQLIDSGSPVSSTCDFQFSLYDALSGGNQIGITQTVSSVSVSRGLFTALLNTGNEFGDTAFNGDARWLWIAVRCPVSIGAYTMLSPRQQLASLPLALPGLRTFQNATSPDIIGGYSGNTVAPSVFGATIAGGGGNVDALNNPCSTCYNSVNTKYGTVGGGFANNIPVTGTEATIAGGSYNTASGSETTVGGGLDNTASGYIATVGGGVDNTASGYEATVPGGNSNTAGGTYSFAAGQRAKALHNGSFVWADSSPFDFSTNVSNSFKVRATGGVRMVVQIDGTGATTVSCLLNSSSAGWSCTSDRSVKENLTAVNSRAVLDKLSALPITEWNIIGTDPNVKHVGPMAQDFYAVFGLGNDDKSIGTVDAQGIAFAAIQGLYQVMQDKEATIATQQKQIDDLQTRLSKVEQNTTAGNLSAQPEPFNVSTLLSVLALIAAGWMWVQQRRSK